MAVTTLDSDLLFQEDLPDLLSKLHECRTKWFDLGVALQGVSMGDLRAIKYQYRDPGECLREMLIMWLSRVHPQPTRRALATALHSRAVGERKIALLVSDKALPVPG